MNSLLQMLYTIGGFRSSIYRLKPLPDMEDLPDFLREE